MDRRVRAVAVFLLMTLACGGSGSGPTPIDPAASATLIVDGQSFTPAKNGMSALNRGGGNTDININNCAGQSVNLSLLEPFVVGSHPMSRTYAQFFNSSGQWDYVQGQGRGTLTFTSTSPRLVGSFAFDMPPLAGTGATGTKFVQGTFDVTYGNGTACK